MDTIFHSDFYIICHLHKKWLQYIKKKTYNNRTPMTKFDLHIINNRSYVTNAKQMRGRWWLCAFACLQINEQQIKNHNYIFCNKIHVAYIYVNQQPFTFQATLKLQRWWWLLRLPKWKIHLKHLECKWKIYMTMKEICARMLKDGELKSSYQTMG